MSVAHQSITGWPSWAGTCLPASCLAQPCWRTHSYAAVMAQHCTPIYVAPTCCGTSGWLNACEALHPCEDAIPTQHAVALVPS
jgi:hypothetical protein